jgi:hypothetical protein
MARGPAGERSLSRTCVMPLQDMEWESNAHFQEQQWTPFSVDEAAVIGSQFSHCEHCHEVLPFLCSLLLLVCCQEVLQGLCAKLCSIFTCLAGDAVPSQACGARVFRSGCRERGR